MRAGRGRAVGPGERVSGEADASGARAQVEQLCAEHDGVDQFLTGLTTLQPKEY